jgi:hypothetical protein
MPKELLVGVAQKKVLDALGIEGIDTWEGAKRCFAELGIIVASRRVGRSSEPLVWEVEHTRGGWNPGHEDGWSESAPASRLTPAQREALEKWWRKSAK